MCKFGLIVVILNVVSGVGLGQSAGSVNPAAPSVRVAKVNKSAVGKYEKFEIELALAGIEVKNPYDPEEMDVFANFTGPDGKTIRINGFYDNYENANQWKLRFSPSIVGQWRYQVFVRNGVESAQTDAASFTSEDSDRHGWIRPRRRTRTTSRATMGPPTMASAPIRLGATRPPRSTPSRSATPISSRFETSTTAATSMALDSSNPNWAGATRKNAAGWTKSSRDSSKRTSR